MITKELAKELLEKYSALLDILNEKISASQNKIFPTDQAVLDNLRKALVAIRDNSEFKPEGYSKSTSTMSELEFAPQANMEAIDPDPQKAVNQLLACFSDLYLDHYLDKETEERKKIADFFKELRATSLLNEYRDALTILKQAVIDNEQDFRWETQITHNLMFALQAIDNGEKTFRPHYTENTQGYTIDNLSSNPLEAAQLLVGFFTQKFLNRNLGDKPDVRNKIDQLATRILELKPKKSIQDNLLDFIGKQVRRLEAINGPKATSKAMQISSAYDAAIAHFGNNPDCTLEEFLDYKNKNDKKAISLKEALKIRRRFYDFFHTPDTYKNFEFVFKDKMRAKLSDISTVEVPASLPFGKKG